jgi:AcrR family transcriptional regulator
MGPNRPMEALDARVRRSRHTVLATTVELLLESGVAGVSVDEVSRRSGVAKTTIYRHWPTKAELVIDACSQISTAQAVPDTGSLAGDVTALVTELAGLLSTARWPSVLPSIVDAAERDPALAEIHRGIQHRHTEPYRAVFERAIERGEVDALIDVSAAIAQLVGPLFYRRWFSREPLGEAFLAGVVQSVLNQATPSPAKQRRARCSAPPADAHPADE